MGLLNVTWNPNDKGTGVVLSNNNLTAKVNSESWIRATYGKSSGKWYWEVKFESAGLPIIGLLSESVQQSQTARYSNVNSRGYYSNNGYRFPENVAYGGTYAAGDVISILLDLDNGKLEFWKNGVSQGISHTNILSMSLPIKAFISAGNTTFTNLTANFGGAPFVYNMPDGYQAYAWKAVNKFLIQLSDGNSLSLTKQYLEKMNPVSYSASSTYSGYNISALFDDNKANNWTANGTKSIIYFEAKDPFVLDSYEMFVVTTFIDRMPKDWAVYGSNDSQNWISVDNKTGYIQWTSNGSSIFKTNSTIPYKYYKFDITANNGGFYLTMAELILYKNINEKIISIETMSEDNLLRYGIDEETEINMNKTLDSKIFIKQSADVMGTGKVFKQSLDTSKIPIKKVSII